MHCPMKLYIKTHIDEESCDDFRKSAGFKRLDVDIQDVIIRNMRKVTKEMSVSEIESELLVNIESTIRSTGMDSKEFEDIYNSIVFKIKCLALKIKQTMSVFDKNAFNLKPMFFPNALFEYMLRDDDLELSGTCDKIEIVDGRYYPVLIKNSKPPMKSVWDCDAVEIVAYAILIEEEFSSDVYVGYVDYEKTGDRRTVVMDVNLRRALFDVMHEIRDIVDHKKMPNVKTSNAKCLNCEYYRLYCS